MTEFRHAHLIFTNIRSLPRYHPAVACRIRRNAARDLDLRRKDCSLSL